MKKFVFLSVVFFAVVCQAVANNIAPVSIDWYGKTMQKVSDELKFPETFFRVVNGRPTTEPIIRMGNFSTTFYEIGGGVSYEGSYVVTATYMDVTTGCMLHFFIVEPIGGMFITVGIFYSPTDQFQEIEMLFPDGRTVKGIVY